MRTGGRVHDAVHRHTGMADAMLALVLVGVIVAVYTKSPHDAWSRQPHTWPVLVLEALVLLALAWRRLRPVPVLCVTAIGAAVAMALLGGPTPVALASLLATYTVASRRDRPTAVWAGAFTGTALVFGAAAGTRDLFTNESLSILVWTGFAAALGQAVRTKQAYVTAVEERALRAEQTREEEARRRVIEERLRIARELHDVVAHHIAVIQVQAGVVDHLLTDRPDAAREALGHVRRSSRMVLDELSGMLDVLRQPDDPITPTDPAPGLDRLVALIDSFAASGLTVQTEVTGEPQPLPAAVDLVAYRLVQEGLTNAHKHGTGSAGLVLAFRPRQLEIEIVNQVAVLSEVGAGSSGPAGSGGMVGGAPVSAGHGLAGMHERAHAVGGRVSAGAEDGAWRVLARIPLERDPDSETGNGTGADEQVAGCGRSSTAAVSRAADLNARVGQALLRCRPVAP